jgi:subtilisin family serine protease
MEISGFSRWLNAALVMINYDQLENIEQLGFVSSIEESQCKQSEYAGMQAPEIFDGQEFPGWMQQTEIHEASLLRENKLDGHGITIAVFDGGFPGVDTHPAFHHLFENNRIKASWDFSKQNRDVYRHNSHGTAVLSCICGIRDSLPLGMATGADFILARTELTGEPWKEELYWIQAAEWAHKMGADIISSSLGYTYHRYFQSDLTGRETPVARAANIAARKGILVINCMGNEGDNNWKYAVTPADADSVLSVGGIEPASGLHLDFSSFGPNMSGEMKPNVVASGKAIAAGNQGWKTVFGTSFSAPIITGFAACAWQLNPEKGNMDIFELIQESSHLFPYYDYAHGYGIPKASKMIMLSGNTPPDSIQGLNISLKPGAVVVRLENIEHDDNFTDKYLYYNFMDKNGEINRYGVYRINGNEPLVLEYNESEGDVSCYIRTKNNYQYVKLK